MSLKNKAISSFNWTILEGVFSQGALFIVGIVLARILSPKDFGIIGIITVFLAIANTIVEAGFSRALIRKNDADVLDYNTVFYTNLVLSLILYVILFITSNEIAIFFEIPILAKVLQYSGVVLLINAFSFIHRTLLTKFLKFDKLALIAITASLISGIIAVCVAYGGGGVWSLVVLTVTRPLINSVLFWIINQWYPKWCFSKNSFIELFEFSYKLLIANLINTVYRNIYYFLIGKFFSPTNLGYYTRAEQFQTPISGNLSNAIQRISFPILSTLQDNQPKLRNGFVSFLKFSVFINFPIMLVLAAMSEPLVYFLVGPKWESSIVLLRLLCIPGLLYPLQILHLNLLLVKGHSDLNLRLEIIKKIVLIPIIVVSIRLGLIYLVVGLVIFSIIEYFINSFFTNRIINYSIKQQLLDMSVFLLIGGITAIGVYSINFLSVSYQFKFFSQILLGISLFIVLNETFITKEYSEIKSKILYYARRIKK